MRRGPTTAFERSYFTPFEFEVNLQPFHDMPLLYQFHDMYNALSDRFPLDGQRTLSSVFYTSFLLFASICLEGVAYFRSSGADMYGSGWLRPHWDSFLWIASILWDSAERRSYFHKETDARNRLSACICCWCQTQRTESYCDYITRFYDPLLLIFDHQNPFQVSNPVFTFLELCVIWRFLLPSVLPTYVVIT